MPPWVVSVAKAAQTPATHREVARRPFATGMPPPERIKSVTTCLVIGLLLPRNDLPAIRLLPPASTYSYTLLPARMAISPGYSSKVRPSAVSGVRPSDASGAQSEG